MTSADAASGSVAVLIMAKAPRAGVVKTRLQPLLGAAGCARLQAALIARTVALAEEVAPSATYLALDPPDHAILPSSLDPVRLLPQLGDDLGARMSHAVDEVHTEHDGPILVIGTDAPTLRREHLLAAACALEAGADVAFGPALDGGYYLVGLRDPAPEVFAIDPMLWGGERVLTASLQAARRAGLQATLLESLRDLDTPTDAQAFLDAASLPADIAALLRAPLVSS